MEYELHAVSIGEIYRGRSNFVKLEFLERGSINAVKTRRQEYCYAFSRTTETMFPVLKNGQPPALLMHGDLNEN